MPSLTNSRPTALKRVVALLLTFAAGVVDIVGYLALYHTFTAHMTGTSVHLGNALVSENWHEAIFAATVVVAFVVGSILGRTIIEIGARNHFRTIASITLGLEVLLLLAFIPLAIHSLAVHGSGESSPLTAPLLAMLAAAMGLQTATLTRVGPLTVHTTFVTGMLNKIAQLNSHALYATFDVLRCESRERPQHRAKRRESWAQARFLFAIWIFYVAGASTGTLVHQRRGVQALFIAVALLVLSIVCDLVQPLSIEEEREQYER